MNESIRTATKIHQCSQKGGIITIRRLKPTAPVMESDDGEEIMVLDYDVTDKPLDHTWFKRLPQPVQARINELHDDVLSDPRLVIQEANELLKKYPYVPMLYSFLSTAYARIGDHASREATVATCRAQCPDYLFGKIAQAQLYLSINEVEKVPEVFEGRLNLQLLYPQRTCFHLSEYMGFTGVLVLYYNAIGRHALAKEHYQMLTEVVAPAHPMLRQLRRALFLSSLRRGFQRVIQMLLRWFAPHTPPQRRRQSRRHTRRRT